MENFNSIDMNILNEQIKTNKASRGKIIISDVKFDDIQIENNDFDWGEFGYNVNMANETYDYSKEAPSKNFIIRKAYAILIAFIFPQIRFNSFVVKCLNEINQYNSYAREHDNRENIANLNKTVRILEKKVNLLQKENTALREKIESLADNKQ